MSVAVSGPSSPDARYSDKDDARKRARPRTGRSTMRRRRRMKNGRKKGTGSVKGVRTKGP
jgi:hypothetical protein